LLDLLIARIPGIGSGGRVYLCEKFERESDLTALTPAEVKRICAAGRALRTGRGEAVNGRIFDDKAKSWSMDDIASRAREDAVFMERRGIRWVSIAEDAYPPLLREIYDPPAVLFYRGVLPQSGKPALAMVGTRKPGAASLRWAYEAARDLSLAGVLVVSGLATGIDAMAHRGALDAAAGSAGAGGTAAPTVSVFGSSVDYVYPASNRSLARRIVASGGLLLSEYPPGTRPAKWTFPARNRIISGLCRCTVIVEAGEKSGALITADFALEQNRSLCLAGDPVDGAFGAGCRKLAEDGAKVVHKPVDILTELGLEI
jgi:DNA processing protein